MSSAISSEDLRRLTRCRRADDLEEGGCHSSTDTEDYYNRDNSLSAESDETVSDLDATATSAAAVKSSTGVPAPNHNYNGGFSASSAAAYHYGSACPSLTAASHYGRARAFSAAATRFGSARPRSFAAANLYRRATASSVTGASMNFACRVCGKEFFSEKAVCGHMKIHALEVARGSGKQDKGDGKDKKAMIKKHRVAVAGGWGVTGKRGRSGLGTSMEDTVKKDSPKNAEPDHPVMDTVVPDAEPSVVSRPTPISFAMPENLSSDSTASMASARTSLYDESSGKKPIHNDAMDIAEAATNANAIPLAEPVVVHKEALPPPPAEIQAQPINRRRARPPHAGRQRPEGYRCSDPECRMWFSTHHALGGHVAAHKNKKRDTEAAAAPLHGGAKEEKLHRCKECPAVFASGLQLGGHMRKHWKGEPIVPKRKLRPSLVLPLPADVAVHRPAGVHPDDFTRPLPIKAESQ
jgi:hypothetical protein